MEKVLVKHFFSETVEDNSRKSTSESEEALPTAQVPAANHQSAKVEINKSRNTLDLVDVTVPSSDMAPSVAPDVVNRRQLEPSQESCIVGPDLIDLREMTDCVAPVGGHVSHGSEQHSAHLLDMPLEQVAVGGIKTSGMRLVQL